MRLVGNGDMVTPEEFTLKRYIVKSMNRYMVIDAIRVQASRPLICRASIPACRTN